MKTKLLMKPARNAEERLEQASAISGAMREMNPELFDSAAASVKRNIASLRRNDLREFQTLRTVH